jgi:LmbE family N-acetylglucosaminyl deacetylase
VPFRLLGFAADEDKAGNLCGGTFARYAAAGAEVTLVCAAARDWSGRELAPVARQLGPGNLILLDYRPGELTAAGLQNVFADVIRSVRPHVVVGEDSHAAVKEAAAAAFSTVRRHAGGSAALPAKLYFRPSGGAGSVGVTTAITVAIAATPELFVRAFPDPWVTGVLERDLFAGLSADPGTASTLAERLAS